MSKYSKIEGGGDVRQTKKLFCSIEGITCGGCANSIKSSLKRFLGILSVEIEFVTRQAEIIYDSLLEDDCSVLEKISNLGYSVRQIEFEFTDRLLLRIEGDTDALSARNEILKIGGVLGVIASVGDDTLSISYDQEKVGIRDLAAQISSLGIAYTVQTADECSVASRKKSLQLCQLFTCLALAIPSLIIMVLNYFPQVHKELAYKYWSRIRLSDLLLFTLSTPIQFYFGRNFYRDGWRAIKLFSADMNVLIVFGTSATYFYSLFEMIFGLADAEHVPQTFFDTCAILIPILLFSKYFEELAKFKVGNLLEGLNELNPERALLMNKDWSADNGTLENFQDCTCIRSSFCHVGDYLKVLPSSRIPADGIVVFGGGFVNESTISGESSLVEKNLHSQVTAGTMNVSGVFVFRATKVGAKTRLSQIVNYIRKIQFNRASIELLASRISKILVPLLILTSVATLVTWILLLKFKIVVLHNQQLSDTSFALLNSISVIVVSCPCALGLSAPIAVLIATSVAAKLGILIKGGDCVQSTSKIKTVVFDKTGTLTLGQPKVTSFELFNIESTGWTAKQLYRVVADAEQLSEHILSKPIIEYLETLQLLQPNDTIPSDICNLQYLCGMGIKCTVFGNCRIVIGNKALMKHENVHIPEHIAKKIYDFEQSFGTCSLVGANENCVALIVTNDVVRPYCKDIVNYLHKNSIKCWMVTGDNQRTAESVASQIGIENVVADALPVQKAQILSLIKSTCHPTKHLVAMVGDGVNDSPALVTADVGVCIGTNVEIAMSSADIVLIKNDLRAFITALDLCKKTFFVIKTNYLLSLAYNLVAIPIAAGVLYPSFHITINPILSGALMSASSASVIALSLLLNKYKPPRL